MEVEIQELKSQLQKNSDREKVRKNHNTTHFIIIRARALRHCLHAFHDDYCSGDTCDGRSAVDV